MFVHLTMSLNFLYLAIFKSLKPRDYFILYTGIATAVAECVLPAKSLNKSKPCPKQK